MLYYKQPCSLLFYASVKETELIPGILPGKGMQICKNIPDVVDHSVLFAGFMIKLHQFPVSGTVDFVTVAVGADIMLLQTGEMAVKLPVKILPVV